MDIKGKKILIVDDDNDIRGMYADVFKKEGFEVEEAVDGLDGLDRTTKNVPDVIFSGIIMPKMDGFALKEALSKNVSTASIPVVLSSHMGRKEDEVRAKEMGVRDFIIQGMVTPKQAVERIKMLFSAGAYLLKFYPEELDGLKLAADLHYEKDFKCPNCGENMVLKLKISDTGNNEFLTSSICLKCGR